MNAISNFFDAASGRFTDPEMFMLADADVKRAVVAMWADSHARLAKTFADKVDAFFSDAQVGYAFLTPQLYRIETEVYMQKLPNFDISQFFTVDSSGSMWDVGTLVYSRQNVGEAAFLAAGAFDVPMANSQMSQATKAFYLAGIGYDWNTQELQRAAMLGRALSSDKAMAAKQAADIFVYNLAMTGKNPAGVAEKGWTGFVNNGSAPSAQVANDGTGSSRLWTAKDEDLILRDINAAITAVETGTGETHIATDVVLPTTAYNYAATKRVGDTNTTVLQYLQANNTAGAGLTIRKSRALETAGTGDTTRMIAYDKNAQVVKFHLPGPHQFLPPFQKSSLTYEVAGIMNVGGLEIREPKAVVYRDSF